MKSVEDLKSKLFFSVLLLLIAIFLFRSSTIAVFADTDDKAPYITSLEILNSTASVGGTIDISLTVVEDGLGISGISICFSEYGAIADGESNSYVILYEPTKGERYTGDHIYHYKVPEDFYGGDYEITWIRITDQAANTRDYSNTEMFAGRAGTFVFKSEQGDTFNCKYGLKIINDAEPPRPNYIIEKIEFLDSDVMTEGELPIRFQVASRNGSHDISDIPIFDISFSGDNSGWFGYSLYPDQVTLLDNGWIQGNIFVPADLVTGRYYILSVGVINPDHQASLYYAADEEKIKRVLEDNSSFKLNAVNGKTCVIKNPIIHVKGISPEEAGNSFIEPILTKCEVLTPTVAKPGIAKVRIKATTEYDDMKAVLIRLLLYSSSAAYNPSLFEAGGESRFSPRKDIDTVVEIPIPSSASNGDWVIQSIMFDSDSHPFEFFPENYMDKNGVYYPDSKSQSPRRYYKNTVTVQDEFDVVFETSMSNPNLEQKIASLKTGETGRVMIDEDGIARKSIFEAIQGKEKTVIFYKKNYQWVFNGKDITEPKDISLFIDFEMEDGESFGFEGKILKVKFPENGKLPGKANIRIKSDYTKKVFDISQNLYLYYLPNGSETPVLENGNPQYIIDDTNHWCYFSITHNSAFLLSGNKRSNTSGKTFTDPKTGYKYKIQSNKKAVVFCGTSKKAKSIRIPELVSWNKKKYKVVKIASSALAGNKSVTKLTIGKNVKSIGSKAFYGCKNLKTIIIKTKHLTAKRIGIKVFKGIKKKAKIKVPKKVRKKYKKLFRKKGLSKKAKVK